MKITLRKIIFLILLVGIGLLTFSLTMDYYTDKEAAEELNASAQRFHTAIR